MDNREDLPIVYKPKLNFLFKFCTNIHLFIDLEIIFNHSQKKKKKKKMSE